MSEGHFHRLPMDARHRVALSKLLRRDEHVSSFRAYREDNRIILEPMVEIPSSEMWIYDNPEVLLALKESLNQPPKHYPGSFAQYADDEL